MIVNSNGRAFDGVDVQIAMLGAIAAEVSEVSYGYSRAHQAGKGFGADGPTSWSMGRKTYDEGSITMSMREAVQIENAAPVDPITGDKDITKIKPFKTIVTYLNTEYQIVADEVTWKFMDNGRKVEVDDLGIGRQYKMFVTSIRMNIPVAGNSI